MAKVIYNTNIAKSFLEKISNLAFAYGKVRFGEISPRT